MTSIRFIPLLAVALAPLASVAADRPNVVLILADDLGVRDLGCFGSSFHETPNLDRLAARGVRLTNAYSASPLCSPTRSSIMTGQYPARIGITAPVCHVEPLNLEKRLQPGKGRVLQANSLTRLATDYHTLAEALREAGYATAHFGKWHLGHNLAAGDAYEPRDQGFDVDFPHTPRAAGPGGGYFAPWKFITDPAITDKAGRHIDARMADEAGAFIRAHKDRPFFVNFWLFSVHSPWNARPESIAHFERKSDPADPQRNPLYAAMVKGLDDAVGRLLRPPRGVRPGGQYARRVLVRQRRLRLSAKTNRPGGLCGDSRHQQPPVPQRQGLAVRRRHARAGHRRLARQDQAKHDRRLSDPVHRPLSDGAQYLRRRVTSGSKDGWV